MRKLISFFPAVVLAASSFNPLVAQEIPRPAPEFAIHMVDGSQKLLSSYRGKTVALCFFFTTCSHCQDTSKLLSRLEPEYAAKGVQIIAAAFNDDAKDLVPDFERTYVRGFPIGYSDRGAVLEFLQKSVMTPLYVPIMVFIDKKGNIQDQFIGDPKFLADPEKNIPAELDKVIAMGGSAKPAVHHVAKK